MGQKRLLIVEDEAQIREILIEYADSLGVISTQVQNGNEALALFKDHTFDAVLSDVKMPIMTGIELLRKLREQGYQIPFVILTGFGDKQMVVEALKLGAFDFIEKPFEPAKLFHVVSLALELGSELNFWKHETAMTDSLIKVGDENSAHAIAEIERIFALVKSGKHYLKQ